MLSQATVDALWDFDDPAGSEARLQQAAAAADGVERAELLTQVARALGLQGRFDAARAVLDAVAAEEGEHRHDGADALVIDARVALERGRVENSAGRPELAIGPFTRAAESARSAGAVFLQVDALHMLAIADPERSEHWTTTAIDLATGADERTRRWLVALWNNRGWSRFEADDIAGAVAAFEQAVAWADRVGTASQQQYAREALTEAGRARRPQQSGSTGDQPADG